MRGLLLCILLLVPLASCFAPPMATKNCARRKQGVFAVSTGEQLQAVVNEEQTTQDEQVDAPASVVFYDEVLDESLSEGVVCARGVCALEYPDEEFLQDDQSLVDRFLSSYLGPRALLAGASILYGTNFPLGAIMNDALPPSAATSARMVMASLALSPFLFKLDPKLSGTAILCGCFTALGYTTQSLALVDLSPAKVAFLGAATVIVCPTLEFFINKKDMSLQKSPQTWLAATLCIVGVGILELYNPSADATNIFTQVGFGDVLAILQAVGFGTSFFITERMMRGQPEQALPITAVQVSVTAFICMIWCLSDGWIGQAGTESFGLPNLFLEPSLGMAAAAVAWTGLTTTALNRFVETTALGRVNSAEASVILATEPLWAALFAALLLSENFGVNDYVGGALIVLACLANALKPSDFDWLFKSKEEDA